MTPEAELRELLVRLADPVIRGDIRTADELIKKRIKVYKKLNDKYGIFVPPRKSFPFQLIKAKQGEITLDWKNMRITRLKEAMLFYYIVYFLRRVEEDFNAAGLKPLLRALFKNKLMPTHVLLEYGVLPDKIEPLPEKAGLLKKIIVLRFERDVLERGMNYRKFGHLMYKVMEKLRKKETTTIAQVLCEYGFGHMKDWRIKTGPWLENYLVTQWRSGRFGSPTQLEKHNLGAAHALFRDHYTAVIDAIKKMDTTPKYEFLPYVLDYLVVTRLKKRIATTKYSELVDLVRSLNIKEANCAHRIGDKTKILVPSCEFQKNIRRVREELQEYANQVYAAVKGLSQKEIKQIINKYDYNLRQEYALISKKVREERERMPGGETAESADSGGMK